MYMIGSENEKNEKNFRNKDKTPVSKVENFFQNENFTDFI